MLARKVPSPLPLSCGGWAMKAPCHPIGGTGLDSIPPVHPRSVYSIHTSGSSLLPGAPLRVETLQATAAVK